MIIFGLKNCSSDDWQDKSELKHTGGSEGRQRTRVH